MHEDHSYREHLCEACHTLAADFRSKALSAFFDPTSELELAIIEARNRFLENFKANLQSGKFVLFPSIDEENEHTAFDVFVKQTTNRIPQELIEAAIKNDPHYQLLTIQRKNADGISRAITNEVRNLEILLIGKIKTASYNALDDFGHTIRKLQKMANDFEFDFGYYTELDQVPPEVLSATIETELDYKEIAEGIFSFARSIIEDTDCDFYDVFDDDDDDDFDDVEEKINEIDKTFEELDDLFNKAKDIARRHGFETEDDPTDEDQ